MGLIKISSFQGILGNITSQTHDHIVFSTFTDFCHHLQSTYNTNFLWLYFIENVSAPVRPAPLCCSLSPRLPTHRELGPSRRSRWPPNPPNWTLASAVAHTHTQACLKIHKTSALSPPPLELFGWEAVRGTWPNDDFYGLQQQASPARWRFFIYYMLQKMWMNKNELHGQPLFYHSDSLGNKPVAICKLNITHPVWTKPLFSARVNHNSYPPRRH